MTQRFLIAMALCLLTSIASAVDGGRRIIFEVHWFTQDAEGRAEPLWEGQLDKGQLESHVYEDSELYQGVPWHVLIDRVGETQLRVRRWVSTEQYRVGDPIPGQATDETFELADLRPMQLAIIDTPDGGRIFANIIPKLQRPALEPAQLTASSLGLDYLCVHRSPVIVDESFVVAELTGLKQYAIVDVPEIALVSFSLTPLDGWEPIGILESGTIEIDLPHGHVLTVTGVRTGPFGNIAPGPFQVFGTIEPSQSSRADVTQRVKERLAEHYDGERLRAMRAAIAANPFGRAGRVTLGSERKSSPHYQRLVGPRGTGAVGCTGSAP